MKLACLVLLLSLSGVQAHVWSQTSMLELSVNGKSMVEAIEMLQKKTQLKFVFNHEELNNYRVNAQIQRKTLEEALDILFSDKPLKYEITGEHVIISKTTEQQQQTPKMIEITGTVVDENGSALPGVTIMIKGTSLGTATDVNGSFKLQVPESNTPNNLLCSFIGMKTQEIKLVNGKTNYKIVMEDEAQKLEDVVVTGYFQRKKVTQTGSEVVVDGEELRKVGSLNLLQAISSFDPGVRTLENNEWGSDPNRMPEITVRGEKGFDLRDQADDSRTNPNAPLYIMDGIEVSASTVFDMDMNRVASFSILKDASATSLYGSRGANGVILITTIRPQAGEIKVSLNANYNISVPDLRSYNLMDAREKLEFERLAGLYTQPNNNREEQTVLDMKYNEVLAEIERGVDSYWLSQPLQTSVNQRYSAYLEGGDEHFRYGINLKFDKDNGVMKKSGRDRVGINVYFQYDIANKLVVRNDISVEDVKGYNSPYGTFSQYAAMNPYERMRDEEGELIREYSRHDRITRNPLINSLLPNTSYEKYTQVRDNLQVQWWATQHLRINGSVGLTKQINRDEAFTSAQSTQFDGITNIAEKGSYVISNGTDMDVEGKLTLDYSNLFFDHLSFNLGVGTEFTTQKTQEDGYTATGFVNDKLTYPSYAQQYQRNGKPSGYFDKGRTIGFLGNINLGWDNRYIVDFSLRTDGSSRFGSDNQFAPFWSVGLAWNVNRENFWQGVGTMKIRASVGSVGSSNFNADQAMTRFIYNSDGEYNGIYGAVLSQYGNTALKWQNTLKYNVGLDMTVWRNIISLNFDAYLERTENLLMNVDVAPSTGFTSYRENLGSLDNKGIEARLRLNLLRGDRDGWNWNVTLSAAHEQDKIRKLSNAMRAMNEQALNIENNTGTEIFKMYEVGRSQNALMLVKSLGIDPATGNEVYVKRDGSTTFDYDPNDRVEVGNTTPKLQGFMNTNLSWNHIELYMSFNYEMGAKLYNSTLATKVEGASPYQNADKRVLYDRWKEPGDIAMFRRIDDQSSVYQSSRLVQKSNFIRMSSLSLTYDIPREKLAKTFIERCKFTFSMTDVFRISTIKQERGTSYPFAWTFSLGANLTF
ncbi:SusC/RagA family TonB-linked outer membrane protein [Odoribacter splanchnicus]|uniref:SusC/RagA family TonB-linked outer membrane protein n=1 Tax=Odoribacter splanchnicus TaxID=28118 RepID=UPI0013A64CE8|nr:SusC/RagA family TonB-linked outer membrane protein [Odoribacter splanchnicus]MDB9212755.1 SusC/RagA family TonB-linked outer membrane protein [Odoribacter splanchnicus]MDB9228545.1 SusC/RagA family TonB-linked outer membrane protein [Odoribacter splanchnicus]MDB9237801.1 SusC/RagA family TonB-linked outer membrane protein [Odoribacter splanchnicus]MDB9241675.1 SusC/RagA family TonB-linked outer membrane protein [Odoribacter splanchnicus]MDB9245641.1 SusC/RagA family TonB-linked outer membr